MRAALWVSVVVPSLFIAERLFGWTGAAAYAVAVAAILPLVLSVPGRMPAPALRLLTVVTGVVIVAAVVIGHRTFDLDLPDRGSDDDDAHEAGASALLRGENPYSKQTYLGNPISPMPGALLLATPFVIAGQIAAQNAFWFAVFFVVLAREPGGLRVATGLVWTTLLSLAVVHDLVTANSHVANGIYVVIALAWLARSRGSAASSVFLGVALASRANFLFLLPCALGWLWRQESPAVAVRSAAWTTATLGLLVAPFYLSDPVGFAPLFTLSKIQRYDVLLPGASVLTGIVTGLAALTVGTRASTRASLFAGCAIVQALPVVAVLGLSVLSGRPYLAALPYGEFAMWFVVMSWAISSGHMPESFSTMRPQRWRVSAAPGAGSASF